MSALGSIAEPRLEHAPHDNGNHGHALAVPEHTSLVISPELLEQAPLVIREQWQALEPDPPSTEAIGGGGWVVG